MRQQSLNKPPHCFAPPKKLSLFIYIFIHRWFILKICLSYTHNHPHNIIAVRSHKSIFAHLFVNVLFNLFLVNKFVILFSMFSTQFDRKHSHTHTHMYAASRANLLIYCITCVCNQPAKWDRRTSQRVQPLHIYKKHT